MTQFAQSGDAEREMEHATRTVRRSRRLIQAQLKKLTWLGETQAALGWAVVLMLLALAGTLYMSQASRIATTGRTVQIMQRDLEDLKRENAQLEREIAESQELEQLEERARQMGFVRALPSDIEYLVIEDYPAATPAPAPVPPAPLVAPAETVWEAMWWEVQDGFRNLIEGESSES